VDLKPETVGQQGHEVQTDPGARAVETFLPFSEYLFFLFVGDARAVVGDQHLHAPARVATADGDLRMVVIVMPDGVLKQVPERRGEHLVCPHGGRGDLGFEPERCFESREIGPGAVF